MNSRVEVYTNDLFEKVLIEPARKGADTLEIVSGFATASMASRHLEELKANKCHVNIKLIVGMGLTHGITTTDHNGFKNLMSNLFSETFTCSYINRPPSVHSKLYVWKKVTMQ